MAPAPAPAPPPAPPPTPQNGGGAVDLLTLLLGVLIALARIDYRNRGSDGQLL